MKKHQNKERSLTKKVLKCHPVLKIFGPHQDTREIVHCHQKNPVTHWPKKTEDVRKILTSVAQETNNWSQKILTYQNVSLLWSIPVTHVARNYGNNPFPTFHFHQTLKGKKGQRQLYSHDHKRDDYVRENHEA